MNLENRVVVITGGSKGIGLACARVFLEQGARVAIVSRIQTHLDAARKMLATNVHTEMADLIDAHAAQRAMASIAASLGPIDVLVNSAGAARRCALDQLDAAAWRTAMDAKFFTTIHAIDAVVKDMASRGSGAIVNIIGMGGRVASPFHLAGGAANAALMLATVGLANAYAPQGLRINGINPGLTNTDRVEAGFKVEAQAQNLSVSEVAERAQRRIAMGRMAEPEEIARTALFLASSHASYVNGAIIQMDGATHPII